MKTFFEILAVLFFLAVVGVVVLGAIINALLSKIARFFCRPRAAFDCAQRRDVP